MPTSLSTYLNIDSAQLKELGCYDTILDSDSLFFINFLRLRDCSAPELKGSYANLHKLFDKLCILLHGSNEDDSDGSCEDIFYKNALELLDMSEFQEICLGYSKKGTSGAGSGDETKRRILNVGKKIIKQGTKEPEIFELVGLFEDKIGPDRISDFIGRVIKDDLIAYSRRIVKELSLDKKMVEIKDGLIWNKFNNKELILLPLDILHELPVAHGWDDIDIVCGEIRKIRDEINKRIGWQWRKYSKSRKRIFLQDLLLEDPVLLQAVIRDYKKSKMPEYDFINDPLGEASWYPVGQYYAKSYPIEISKKKIYSIDDLIIIVREICEQFKSLVENKGLNEMLYDNTKKPKKERIAQKLFLAVSDCYCKANNIDISPEVNSGRGALDFKFSVGYEIKVIVEVKLTTNNKLIHGYKSQLGEYQRAEGKAHPIYLVIQNTRRNSSLRKLEQNYALDKSENIPTPELIIVDAILKPTASRI